MRQNCCICQCICQEQLLLELLLMAVFFASEKGSHLEISCKQIYKKDIPYTPKVGATCAGLVADMQILSLQILLLLKLEKWNSKETFLQILLQK